MKPKSSKEFVEWGFDEDDILDPDHLTSNKEFESSSTLMNHN